MKNHISFCVNNSKRLTFCFVNELQDVLRFLGDIPAGRRVERLFGNQAQTDGGLRYTAKRGALHSGVQDRQGAEGGDRRHERRDGACAVRLYLYARNGCERPETVCGYPSSRYAVGAT